MSYCLLLQGADGSLRLLADAPFASRNEALAAVAAQAESGGVDGAADQVWLIDLDSIAPVVLVGRASAPVEPAWAAAAGLAPEAAQAVSSESDELVAEGLAEAPATDEPTAPEPPVEEPPAEELSVEEPPVEEPPVEVPPVEESPIEETRVDEPIVDEPAAPEVASEDPAIPEALEDVHAVESDDALNVVAGIELPEPGAVFEPDASLAPSPANLEPESDSDLPVAESILDDLVLPEPEVPAATVEEDSFSDLREALERSAAQMAADGVTVPFVPSVVGAEPIQADDDLDIECATVEETIVDEVITTEVPDVAEPAEVDLSARGETDDADIVSTVEQSAPTGLPTSEVTVDEPAVEESTEAAGWPWADSLPVIEEEPVVSDSVDDASAEEEPVTETVEEGLSADGAEVPTPHVQDPASEAPPVSAGEARATETPAVPIDLTAIPDLSLAPEPSAYTSDVIAPASVATPGYTASEHAVADMSCDDCVWVDTCPNKDQRDPASCGSFQWK